MPRFQLIRCFVVVLVALVVALVVMFGCDAHADADLDTDTEAAKRHFEVGMNAYSRSEYSTALDEFEKAQKIKPCPAMIFNIAKSLDRLEHWGEAILAYQRYLDANPDDPNGVKESAERIKILKDRVPKMLPPPVPLTPPVQLAPSSPAMEKIIVATVISPVSHQTSDSFWRARDKAALGIAVAGGASLISGIITGSMALSACPHGTTCNHTSYTTANALANPTNILLVVGAAAVVVGGVMLVVDFVKYHNKIQNPNSGLAAKGW